MAKKRLLFILFFLLFLSILLSSCKNEKEIIVISPSHVCYKATEEPVFCSFSIQCYFSCKNNTLQLLSMEGENIDKISSVRLIETTPDYAKGKKQNGGYYESYSVEISVSESITITRLNCLINGTKRTIETQKPIIVQLKDNIFFTDLYYSFIPYMIYTISFGDEYNYIIHVEKNINLQKIEFIDYLTIDQCNIIDLDSLELYTYKPGKQLHLIAGHNYSINLSFDYSDDDKGVLKYYCDLKSSFCITYSLEERPNTQCVCSTDLSCSGILNEDCWVGFMKEVLQ